MLTETLPRRHYTEREQADIEAIYMGTELEARKRFQRGNSFNRVQSNSFNSRQSRDRSFLRDSRYNRYNSKSRYDHFK